MCIDVYTHFRCNHTVFTGIEPCRRAHILLERDRLQQNPNHNAHAAANPGIDNWNGLHPHICVQKHDIRLVPTKDDDLDAQFMQEGGVYSHALCNTCRANIENFGMPAAAIQEFEEQLANNGLCRPNWGHFGKYMPLHRPEGDQGSNKENSPPSMIPDIQVDFDEPAVADKDHGKQDKSDGTTVMSVVLEQTSISEAALAEIPELLTPMAIPDQIPLAEAAIAKMPARLGSPVDLQESSKPAQPGQVIAEPTIKPARQTIGKVLDFKPVEEVPCATPEQHFKENVRTLLSQNKIHETEQAVPKVVHTNKNMAKKSPSGLPVASVTSSPKKTYKRSNPKKSSGPMFKTPSHPSTISAKAAGKKRSHIYNMSPSARKSASFVPPLARLTADRKCKAEAFSSSPSDPISPVTPTPRPSKAQHASKRVRTIPPSPSKLSSDATIIDERLDDEPGAWNQNTPVSHPRQASRSRQAPPNASPYRTEGYLELDPNDVLRYGPHIARSMADTRRHRKAMAGVDDISRSLNEPGDEPGGDDPFESPWSGQERWSTRPMMESSGKMKDPFALFERDVEKIWNAQGDGEGYAEGRGLGDGQKFGRVYAKARQKSGHDVNKQRQSVYGGSSVRVEHPPGIYVQGLAPAWSGPLYMPPNPFASGFRGDYGPPAMGQFIKRPQTAPGLHAGPVPMSPHVVRREPSYTQASIGMVMRGGQSRHGGPVLAVDRNGYAQVTSSRHDGPGCRAEDPIEIEEGDSGSSEYTDEGSRSRESGGSGISDASTEAPIRETLEMPMMSDMSEMAVMPERWVVPEFPPDFFDSQATFTDPNLSSEPCL